MDPGAAASLATAVTAALLFAAPVPAADPPVEPLVISRATTWITEPLRADGTPDYPRWLDRKYGAGVTPGTNAATVLDEVRMIGDVRDAAFVEQRRRALLGPWDDADAPLVAAWLGTNAANLERVELAVRSRPRYWVAFGRELAFDTPVPSRLGLREIASAFRARALRRAAVEDGESARGELIQGLRFAARVDQGARIMDRLIGGAVRGIVTEPAVALANPPPARRAQAAALLAGLRAIPPSASLDEALDIGERLQFLAGYLDLYRAARKSPAAWQERVSGLLEAFAPFYDGQNALPANLARIPGWAIDWNELFRDVNDCWLNPDCDAGFAAARRDLESPGFERLLDAARTEPDARRRIARAFLTLQTPAALGRARVSWNEQAAITRAALVAAAAALFHLDHGRYPEFAAALSSGPASAGFDPSAAHAGYAFRYAATSDGRRFFYAAAPLAPGETGVRVFCADSSGRLAAAADGVPSMTVDGLCGSGLTTLVARTSP